MLSWPATEPAPTRNNPGLAFTSRYRPHRRTATRWPESKGMGRRAADARGPRRERPRAPGAASPPLPCLHSAPLGAAARPANPRGATAPRPAARPLAAAAPRPAALHWARSGRRPRPSDPPVPKAGGAGPLPPRGSGGRGTAAAPSRTAHVGRARLRPRRV